MPTSIPNEKTFTSEQTEIIWTCCGCHIPDTGVTKRGSSFRKEFEFGQFIALGIAVTLLVFEAIAFWLFFI